MTYTTKRQRIWRNLMVIGINECLAQKSFELELDPSVSHGERPSFNNSVPFEHNGVKGTVHANSAGFDEILVRVEVMTPARITAQGWVERKTGAHLQYNGLSRFNLSNIPKGVDHLADLDVKPVGYKDTGKFFF